MNDFKKISAGLLSLVMVISILYFQLERAEASNSSFLMETVLAPKSLCGKNEQLIWSCTTVKNKIASVCASKNLTMGKGYLQYRFGTLGKVELQLPTEREGSQKFFKFSRYTRPLVTMPQLTFENGDYAYEIHDDYNAEEKPEIRSASLDVKKNGSEKTTSITCKNPTAGSLMKLEDIVVKDENGF